MLDQCEHVLFNQAFNFGITAAIMAKDDFNFRVLRAILDRSEFRICQVAYILYLSNFQDGLARNFKQEALWNLEDHLFLLIEGTIPPDSYVFHYIHVWV